MNNNYIENNNSNLNNQSEYISQQELNNNISNLYINSPTDNSMINNNNEKEKNNQIPIDLRYKIENRIYKQNSLQKNNFNENQNDLIVNNKNIDLMGSSEGEEMKFKPSYQIQNINENRRKNFNVYQVKNENKNSILTQHRIYNEDF